MITASRWRALKINRWSSSSRRAVRTNLSANEFRPRRPVRQPQDFRAFGAEDLIESGGELAVAIAEQQLGLHGAVLELQGQVPGPLGHPLAGRTGRDAAEVDLAAGELNKKEDVEALEPGRVDGKEVSRQHLGGMLPDKLAPGDLAAARSGRNALAAGSWPPACGRFETRA